MDVVPCILAEGLTAEQRRAYILADNRLAELAEWDRQALRVTLAAPTLEVEEWRVVITKEWVGDDSLDVWVP